MTADANPAMEPSAAGAGRGRLVVTALCVFALFVAFSAVRMPVPGPNEPHYLGKAKHYWDEGYCPGDFFLDSADTHLVFYQTFGWVTRYLTLPQTAIVGRVVALLLLASGWTAFVSKLFPHRWAALWTASVFASLAAAGNFSGEWVVGSVEAKVFSYGFVFLGLAALVDRRWIPAGLWIGLAVSFHPVVGVWTAAAAVFAMVVTRQAHPNWMAESEPPWPGMPRLAYFVMAMSAFALTSLPGLMPALDVVGSASKKVQFDADFIVVFYRLKHHLDPMDFPLRGYLEYGVLLGMWVVTLLVLSADNARQAWFRWFVTGSLLIAAAGLLIGFGPRPPEEMPFFAQRMKLMKFYPFRLADVMLPAAVAVAVVRLVLRVTERDVEREEGVSPGGGIAAWALSAVCILMSLVLPAPQAEVNPSRMSSEQLADWKTACQWIEKNTPAESSFVTPRNSWAFKWYAQRAEYVSLKDCPQDAAGIVEWNRRLRYRTTWGEEHFNRGYSLPALRELRKVTGATHMIATRQLNVPLAAVYANAHYAVYSLGDLR